MRLPEDHLIAIAGAASCLCLLTIFAAASFEHAVNVSIVSKDESQAKPERTLTPLVSQAAEPLMQDDTIANPIHTTTPAAASPNKSTASTQPSAHSTCDKGTWNAIFICLLNEYRTTKGKSALQHSTSLAAVAQAHSAWMNETGIFSHTGNDGSTFYERCETAGTTCRAENIARGAASPAALLKLWQTSPSHNDNLLGPYTSIGLGISGSYVTALFR